MSAIAVFQLQNIRNVEPEPGLFTVPHDYTVTHQALPAPDAGPLLPAAAAAKTKAPHK
jgi:hypothetical protein